MSQLAASLVGRWFHSREEDGAGVRVYRRVGYAFPPSRGRPGMELQPDGRLIGIGIGRGDGQRSRAGRWSLEDGKVRLAYDDGGTETLTVLSVDDDALRVAVE